MSEAIELARRGRDLLLPPPQYVRTNLVRVVLVACGGFAAISAFDSIWKHHDWAEAFGRAAVFGLYYGGLTALTMPPGAAVHLICLSAVARHTAHKTTKRIAAIALSPLLGIGMYLTFESSVENRSKLLATAFAFSVIYGVVVRLPAGGR